MGCVEGTKRDGVLDKVARHPPFPVVVQDRRYCFDRGCFVFETALVLDHDVVAVRRAGQRPGVGRVLEDLAEWFAYGSQESATDLS